jgi:sulfite reductase (NADPH) flavoprotein alpha-component
LDVAFSRDQSEKVYVQDRMLANSQELYQWLEKGAYFCVCGDASRMAADVDRALHQVIEAAGNKSAEQAVEYVKQMKADKRYLKDVY